MDELTKPKASNPQSPMTHDRIASTEKRRSLFRFTTRDVIWLTVVVAILLAWSNDRGDLKRELKRPHPPMLVDVSEKVKMGLKPGETLEVTHLEDGGLTIRTVSRPKVPATPNVP